MRNYSLRYLSATGRIIRRCDFRAASDHEAISAANAIIGDSLGELRNGHRVVTAWRQPARARVETAA